MPLNIRSPWIVLLLLFSTEEIYADESKSSWQPELGISYLSNNFDDNGVFFTARITRLGSTLLFTGLELSSNFTKANVPDDDENVHLSTTFAGLVGYPFTIRPTYTLSGHIALGVAIGEVGSIDPALSIYGEPRIRVDFGSGNNKLFPIISIGYFTYLASEGELSGVRVSAGFAF